MVIDYGINREKFLRQLRENPLNRYQIFTSQARDNHSGRCALAMGMEGLNVFADTTLAHDLYNEAKFLLGIDHETLVQFWNWNDIQRQTYLQIADLAERRWKDESDSIRRSMS